MSGSEPGTITTPAPLIEVRGLTVRFGPDEHFLPAVEDVSLSVALGRTLGLVGESGCGKSVTSLAIMRLLKSPPARISSGQAMLEGQDLLALPETQMDMLRGARIAMIFQEPMTSLNPVFRVGRQIAEAIIVHEGGTRRAAQERAIELMRRVGIPDPRERAGAYPHELSGGMRQRIMIAMAIACKPRLLIADEPTTALDVTVQAQILALLDELRHEFGLAMLLISHDLGVVAQVANRIAVMYAGRIVEEAPTEALFAAPRHPYTIGLLNSMPRLDRALSDDRRLAAIAGVVPSPAMRPDGCAFRNRCAHAFELCGERPPPFVVGPDHRARCWLHV